MRVWFRRAWLGLLAGALTGAVTALLLNLLLSQVVNRWKVHMAEGPVTAGQVESLGAMEEALRRSLFNISLGFGAIVAAVLIAVRIRHARELGRISRDVIEAGAGRKPESRAGDSPEMDEVVDVLTRFAQLVESAREGSERAQILARTVFQEVPVGLAVVDPRLVILDANPALTRLFRFRSSIEKRALIDLVREPAIVKLFEEGVRKRPAGWESNSAVVRVAAETGDEKVVEVTVRSVPNTGRPGEPSAVGVVRDVTERERTETMRKRFVADVSHELRTPIASIRAAIETLLEEGTLTGEQRQMAGIIERRAAHMAELVSDLMDLSQIEAGSVTLEVEPVPVIPLLESVLEDLAPAAQVKHVPVEIEGPKDLGILGDQRRLAQIFRNLIDNAIKFSPEGGRVDILVEGDGTLPGGRWIRAVVHIVDRGIGIPKSEQLKIFQRFYRVDPSRAKSTPGTGLGLAIVKHLLILHEGTIKVDSDPGRGSRFTVTLPAAAIPKKKLEEQA